MATAFAQDYFAPAAFTPAKPVLRLVEDVRPIPPSWMFAPNFRADDENRAVPAVVAANPLLVATAPAFVASEDLEF